MGSGASSPRKAKLDAVQPGFEASPRPTLLRRTSSRLSAGIKRLGSFSKSPSASKKQLEVYSSPAAAARKRPEAPAPPSDDDDEPMTALEEALAEPEPEPEPELPERRSSLEESHEAYRAARAAALRDWLGDAAGPSAASEAVASPPPEPAPAPASRPPRPTRPAPASPEPKTTKAPPRASRLVALIEDDGLDVAKFGSFLNRSFAGENLAFVLRCFEYKRLWRPDYDGDASIKGTALEIAAQFLNESAPDLVSLPRRVAAAVAADVASEHFTSSLFDAAMHHVAEELSRRNLAAFLRDERRRDVEDALLGDADAPAREAKRILDDGARGPAFRKFLADEYASESADFYDATTAYRRLFCDDAVDDDGVAESARYIGDKYLRDGWDSTPVNVSAKGLRAVLRRLDGSDPLDMGVFDALRVEVLKLLARDKVPRFRLGEKVWEPTGGDAAGKKRRGSFFATTRRPSISQFASAFARPAAAAQQRRGSLS